MTDDYDWYAKYRREVETAYAKRKSGKISGHDMANLNRVVRIWAQDTYRDYPQNFVEAFPEALAWFLSNSDVEILRMPNIGRGTLAWARQKAGKDTP